MTRLFLLALSFCTLDALLLAAPPNVLFIISDDLNYPQPQNP